MGVIFPTLDATAYRPHPLHGAARAWPETNCYVDLWIEVLASMGCEPRAMLGFTASQDFEGDQFTFFKAPLEDLEALYGLRVTELAVFNAVEDHIAVQMARGRLCLVEVDGWFLPDTQGVSYRTEHGKTTIAPNRLDIEGRRLEYFHNGGYFALEGEDFDGVFQRQSDPGRPFLPYTEFVKFPERLPTDSELRAVAATLLRGHLARRPTTNPVRAFQAAITEQAEALAERPFGAFHAYAFNTLRQVGANFELLGDHLVWLGGADATERALEACRTLADSAKAVQFQLARAVMHKRFDRLAGSLGPASEAYDMLFDDLAGRLAA